MDNGELISLLESLLSPATEGTAIEQPPTPGRRGTAGATTRPLWTDSFNSFTLGAQSASLSPSADLAALEDPVLQSPEFGETSPSLTGLMRASMPVGIAVIDVVRLRIRRANRMLLSMLGYAGDTEQVRGQRLDQMILAFAGSDIEAALGQVMRTGTAFSAIVEVQSTKAGAGVTYRRCTLSPLRDESGHVESVLMTLLDVTEQVQARAYVEASNRRVREYERGAHVRSAVAGSLWRGRQLPETLALVAEQIGLGLGDGCAIFLADAQGTLWPWALATRDPHLARHLHTAYTQHPLRAGEGLAGQVALEAVPIVRVAPITQAAGNAAPLAPSPDPLGQVLGIYSVACVPLRDPMQTLGALVLFSMRRAVGGTEGALTEADADLLGELGGQVALHIQNLRLRDEVENAAQRQHLLLNLATDGVAIYDHTGQIRSINAPAQMLLAHPAMPLGQLRSTGGPAVARRLLDANGVLLPENHAPWARALRGEAIGASAPERLTLEWSDGVRRHLLARAVPVRDSTGEVESAIVTLREDPSMLDSTMLTTERLPRISKARTTVPIETGTDDLGDLCAKVARAHSAVNRRRLEVRMPKQAIPLVQPEHLVERVVASLIETAANALPARVALSLNVWLDNPNAPISQPLTPGRTAADQRRATAGPARTALRPPDGADYDPRLPSAIVHICALEAMTDPGQPANLAEVTALAAALGGMAWEQHDPETGRNFLLRIPLVTLPVQRAVEA